MTPAQDPDNTAKHWFAPAYHCWECGRYIRWVMGRCLSCQSKEKEAPWADTPRRVRPIDMEEEFLRELERRR